MPALSWYLHRLRTMSAGELAWRAVTAGRDTELWGRVAFGVEPRHRPGGGENGDAGREPGFRVCDAPVGRWTSPPTDAERAWRDRLVRQADRVALHRLSFFDLVDGDLGNPVDWNRDHGSGTPAPLRFAPRIDYRDHRVTGDAKVVWEPNRHHQLAVLGRAYRATGDARYAGALAGQLASWIEQCPFGRGMNWRSPLELAIRLINWVWAIDLARESARLAELLPGRLRQVVYLHLWQIARSYSRGSSANNHRIGEAAGVFITTSYFPGLDAGGRWRRASRGILEEEIIAQTHPDGGSREQAVAYQLFVLQFFLLAGLTARRTGEDFSSRYWTRLERMLEFIGRLGEGGAVLPMIGDSDDGYVLDLGGRNDPRVLLGIGAVLFRRPDFKSWAGEFPEAAFWLLGEAGRAAYEGLAPAPPGERLTSRALPDAGYYLLQCGHRGATDRVSVVFDCGALGFTSIAAHGHADALSFTLRAFGRDVVVDPGTYDYFSFPAWREYFRSTRAHSTVVVDGLDQSAMLGPFLWGSRAQARCVAWEPGAEGGRVSGEHDGYRRLPDPVVHRRTLDLDAPARVLTVRDDLVARGTHEVAAYFHLAEDVVVSPEGAHRFTLDVGHGVVTLEVDPRFQVSLLRGSEEPIGGWVSRHYHVKVPSATVVARATCQGGASFVSRLVIRP
jgi:hypothetical protein